MSNDPAEVMRRARRNGARKPRGSKLGPIRAAARDHREVIEFWLTVTTQDGTVRTERYRLITTLADWRPAGRRAGRRLCLAWAIESATAGTGQAALLAFMLCSLFLAGFLFLFWRCHRARCSSRAGRCRRSRSWRICCSSAVMIQFLFRGVAGGDPAAVIQL